MILTGENKLNGRQTSASDTLSTKTLTESEMGSKLKLCGGERKATERLDMAQPLETEIYLNFI